MEQLLVIDVAEPVRITAVTKAPGIFTFRTDAARIRDGHSARHGGHRQVSRSQRVPVAQLRPRRPAHAPLLERPRRVSHGAGDRALRPQ